MTFFNPGQNTELCRIGQGHELTDCNQLGILTKTNTHIIIITNYKTGYPCYAPGLSLSTYKII